MGEKLLRQTKNGVFRTAKTKEVAPKRQLTHEVVTPDGSMRLSVAPQIVELSSLKQAAGAMQPRDRSRAESAVGVRERAANLDPSRLQAAPTSDQGAPVVAADGTILSGNGRALSIGEAYRDPNLKAQAEAYRAALGPEAAGMKEPVLVMRAPADMPEAQMREFADLSNRSSIASMSATERAIRDANRLGIEAFAGYKGGELTSPANRRFLQDFLARAVTPNELGAMSKDGALTKEGQDRVNAAILAAAYRDADTLSLMLEATDSNIKSVVTAMREAAGKFAELRAAMDAGLVGKNLDAGPSLVQAVKLISHLRDKGVKPGTYFAQSDAFDVRDPLVEDWVRAFYNDDLSRALSQQKMAEVLNAYADEAIKHQTGGFIEDATTARDVIAAAVKQRNTGGQDSLFAGVSGNYGAGNAGGRGETPGREPTGGGGTLGERVRPTLTHETQSRIEHAIDEFHSVYGRKPSREVMNYAAAIEAAKESRAGLKEIVEEIRRDPQVSSQDAADLAALVGHDTTGLDKGEALDKISLAKGYLSPSNIRSALDRGETAHVPQDAVQEAHAAINALSNEVPKGVLIGVMTRIAPATGKNGPKFLAGFRTPGGFLFAWSGARSKVLGYRAAYMRGQGRIGIVHTNFAAPGSSEHLVHSISGKVRHELVHALRDKGFLTGAEFDALADHAENLQILDMELHRFLRYVGDPDYAHATPGKTLRDAYEKEYANETLADKAELLRQEAAAHLVELYHHAIFSPSAGLLREKLLPLVVEVEPTIKKMFSGEIAARDPAEVERLNRGEIAELTPYQSQEEQKPQFALSGTADRDTGRSMRRDLDKLGYYSAALEAAKGLKQAKGTPEQMLAQLEKGGAKKAEIDATNLRQFMEGKKSVTRDEIVKHLEENRVGLKEVAYGGSEPKEIQDARHLRDELIQRANNGDETTADRLNPLHDLIDEYERYQAKPKWAFCSLDPNNPTYRETVLHLPEPSFEFVPHPTVPGKFAVKEPNGSLLMEVDGKPRAFYSDDPEIIKNLSNAGNLDRGFQSGHFPEPNITGHMMTSLVKDAEGKPVFLLDQIQSDWGQKLRDAGGARDEAKIADLKSKLDAAERDWHDMEVHPDLYQKAPGTYPEFEQIPWPFKRPFNKEGERRWQRKQIAKAEYDTAAAAAPGHPLVNTTSQWVTTTLRRAINQAIESGADKIAIPSGDTVLSYNPGDKHGMNEFYGKIVPLALKKIMGRHDAAYPEPSFVDKLETPTRGAISHKNEIKGPNKFGFTVFPITDAVRASVEVGQPLFALGGDKYRLTEEEKPYAIVWGSEAGLAAADLMRQRQRLAGLETQATGGDDKAADQARMRAAMIDQKAQTLVREWSASSSAENKAAAGDLATAAAGLNTAFAAQDWNAFRAAARDLDTAMGKFEDFTRRAYDAYEAKRATGEAEAAYTNAAAKIADHLSAFDRARFDAHFKTREAFDDIASEADFYGEDFDAAVSKKESPDIHANIKLFHKIEKRFPELASELRAAVETQPGVQDQPQEEEQGPVYALSAAPGVSPVLRPLSEALEKLRATMGLPEKLGRHGISPAGGATVHPDARSDRDVAASLDDLALAGVDHVGAMLGDSLEAAKTAHAAELERLGDPKSADRLESGFAAFFRQFVRNPDAAQADAPRFYRELEDLLDARDPALLEQMQAMQDLMKMTQVQAKLAQLGIDPKFQAEFGVPRQELFPRLANSVAPYVRAATAYKALAKSPQAADTYLAKLPSQIRDYVLFQGRRDVAALHPLVRIKALTDLVYKMQWEALRNQLRNTSKDGGPERIYLAPKKAQDVNDITMRLAAAELNNAAAFTGASPDAKARGEVATTPIMNELRDRSPEVYHELLRRMGKAKIAPWSTVKSIYPPTAKLVAKGWMDQREAAKLADGAANGSPPQGPGNPPSPPAGGPGGGPAPADFGVPKDRRKARNMFLDAWIRTIQPEAYSEDARKADARFAEMAAAKAQQQDALAAKYEDDYIKWERIPEGNQFEFFKKFELGQLDGMSEWEREQGGIVNKAMDWAYAEELKMGSKAYYRDNYIGHVWDKPKEYMEFIKSLESAQKLGPTWFQKARMFELIQQGLDAGFKLKTTNPIELMNMRLIASIHMREAMRLLKDMEKQYGLAVKAEGAPEHLIQNGWRVIDAPDQEKWLIAPDIQPLWNNTLDSKGLWARPGKVGGAFRIWMAFKNVWVPLKLAWSGFHPLHVWHINIAHNLARAKKELEAGRYLEAAKNAAWTADALTFWTFSAKRGAKLRAGWDKTVEDRTPEESANVQTMVESGYSPHLAEQLRIDAKKQLRKALVNLKREFDARSVAGVSGRSAQVFWYGFKRFMERQPINLIFEEWIPNLKSAALFWDEASFAERNPDIWANPVQKKVAQRTIASQVDERFGQMFYGSLFWNKTLRDALSAALISLGWQTGGIRGPGGAVLSPLVQIYEKATGKKASETMRTVRAAQNNTSYWLIYFTTFAFVINAMMTKMFTGEDPKDLDFEFARIGGNNPDGTPRRVTNMSYLREGPMWMKHMEDQGGGIRGAIWGTADMALNKSLVGPFAEIFRNRDYYGYQLYDPESPYWLAQLAGSVLNSQLNPITISSARHAADIAGTWWDRSIPLSLLGFGPAPAYAARTSTQNRIAHLYNEFVAPKSRPYTDRQHDEARNHAMTAFKVARQKGDAELMAEAMKELRAINERPPKGTPSDIFQFSKLSASQQMAVLESAPPEEAKKYIGHERKTLRVTPEFMKFRLEHARQTMPQPMQ
jgi:hypothetical protein